MQDVADNAEAPPRGVAGALVGIFRRGAAQNGQRLRGRLPQDRHLACLGDRGRKARGGVIVRRGRRPNPFKREFPFPELSIHGRHRAERIPRAQVKLSVSAPVILN